MIKRAELAALHARHLAARNRRPTTAIAVPTAEWLCRQASLVSSVLELGSGFSSWALRALQLEHPTLEVWTVDDDPAWLRVVQTELLHQGLSTAHCLTLDVMLAQHANQRFDLVFVDMDSTATRVAYVEPIVRWLKPGGLLVLDDWQMAHYREPMTRALQSYGITVTEVPETIDAFGRYVACGRTPSTLTI